MTLAYSVPARQIKALINLDCKIVATRLKSKSNQLERTRTKWPERALAQTRTLRALECDRYRKTVANA